MVYLDYVFYAFIAVALIQVIYYIFFLGQFTFSRQEKISSKNIPISIIIYAKNQANSLITYLPHLLKQDYPNFEVILINNASDDNTLEVMEDFSLQHSNIKIVDVKNNEAFWGSKKYALTLGIKAASHNYLLFTNCNSKPISKHWITTMTSLFSNKTSIILGYGTYSKIKNSILNKLIRFNALFTAVQYFTFAKIGMPYMGIDKNLAYSKSAFFNAKGFIKHIKIHSGHDNLFINEVANKNNTAICFVKDSFTKTNPKTSFREWIKQNIEYANTTKYYKISHKISLIFLYISQIMFWTLSLLLLVFQYKYKIVITLFFSRIITQYFIIGISAKKLNEKDLIFFIPFLEIFLIIIQLPIFIRNLFSKPKNWK